MQWIGDFGFVSIYNKALYETQKFNFSLWLDTHFYSRRSNPFQNISVLVSDVL